MSFEASLLTRLVALVRQGEFPVIGLNGPVGAGKSILARRLAQQAAAQGLNLAVASIDDAYLPWHPRLLAMAGNPFSVDRVPPGSHDPGLLVESIVGWRRGRQGGTSSPGLLRLPRFDKRLRQGAGDRSGFSQHVADGLLLEGWLIGCRPLGVSQIQATSGSGASLVGSPCLTADEWAWLPRWNQALETYQPLWQQLNGLWVLWPMDWRLPRRWRFQAEAKQRRLGGGWLSGTKIEQLVRSSLCSLPPELYLKPLLTGANQLRLLDCRRRSLWEGPGRDFDPSDALLIR